VVEDEGEVEAEGEIREVSKEEAARREAAAAQPAGPPRVELPSQPEIDISVSSQQGWASLLPCLPFLPSSLRSAARRKGRWPRLAPRPSSYTLP
jgi:hypothetical protein